jgi:hypothetical protein
MLTHDDAGGALPLQLTNGNKLPPPGIVKVVKSITGLGL